MAANFSFNSADSYIFHEHRLSIIKNSWDRCQTQFGLAKSDNEKMIVLTESELKTNRQAANAILQNGKMVIESVRHMAKKADYCLLISDNNCVVIEDYADTPSSYEFASQSLLPGSVCKEENIGTNGIGTCIVSKQTVSVNAADHYTNCLRKMSCSAAPIYLADGSVLGALNLTKLVNENYVESFFTYSFIQEAAKRITSNIFCAHFGEYNIISLKPSEAESIFQSNALLAFNGDGKILGVTEDSLHFLEQMDSSSVIGQNMVDVFPISLDAFYSSHNATVEINEGLFRQTNATLIKSVIKPKTNKKEKTSIPKNTSITITNDEKIQKFSGTDKKIQHLVRVGRKLFNKSISLLILGETGVGKDTFSKLLHEQSPRADKPFVAINCAAIPESLLDSELFGYMPGTFTDGLKEGKVGKIIASNGGTLFLDEIGDMPLSLQAHLLRVLEEREVTPLGAVDPIHVDINVICATHKNIYQLVEKGLFRQDLLYRLRQAEIELPPLKDRSNIREIVAEIISNYSSYEFDELTISDDVWELFETYHWPGNIRELKSALMYALCFIEDQLLSIEHLSVELLKSSNENKQISSDQKSSIIKFAEADFIEKLLSKYNWNVSATARELGINRTTLHRKIKKYQLIGPHKLS